MIDSDAPVYLDGSVLLAVLPGQRAAAAAAARLFDEYPRRGASVLLEAECRTVLRRAARAAAASLPPGWLVERERDLDA